MNRKGKPGEGWERRLALALALALAAGSGLALAQAEGDGAFAVADNERVNGDERLGGQQREAIERIEQRFFAEESPEEMFPELAEASGEEFEERFLATAAELERLGAEVALLTPGRAEHRTLGVVADRTFAATEREYGILSNLLYDRRCPDEPRLGEQMDGRRGESELGAMLQVVCEQPIAIGLGGVGAAGANVTDDEPLLGDDANVTGNEEPTGDNEPGNEALFETTPEMQGQIVPTAGEDGLVVGEEEDEGRVERDVFYESEFVSALDEDVSRLPGRFGEEFDREALAAYEDVNRGLIALALLAQQQEGLDEEVSEFSDSILQNRVGLLTRVLLLNNGLFGGENGGDEAVVGASDPEAGGAGPGSGGVETQFA